MTEIELLKLQIELLKQQNIQYIAVPQPYPVPTLPIAPIWTNYLDHGLKHLCY